MPQFNSIAGWSPANFTINDILLKIRFFGLHFCRRKYWCIFNHFYIIRPKSYRIRWNYAAVMAITPFKVPRSPSLVPIESSYAISYSGADWVNKSYREYVVSGALPLPCHPLLSLPVPFLPFPSPPSSSFLSSSVDCESARRWTDTMTDRRKPIL